MKILANKIQVTSDRSTHDVAGLGIDTNGVMHATYIRIEVVRSEIEPMFQPEFDRLFPDGKGIVVVGQQHRSSQLGWESDYIERFPGEIEARIRQDGGAAGLCRIANTSAPYYFLRSKSEFTHIWAKCSPVAVEDFYSGKDVTL